MASTPIASAGEYEFDESQNRVIGSLARRMGLVGMMFIVFGILQMFNGISSLFMSRNPERMLETTQRSGLSPEQIGVLKQTLADGSWSSPLVASSLAFALAGLLLLLVGVGTRQASVGFAHVAHTKGSDISRLMDALRALNFKYGLIYYMILAAAILSLVALLIRVWHSWSGGA